MRIAVVGTHGSGKTTLIDDFIDGHRDYAHMQEPYWELAQRGVTFADGPSLDDLAEQLEQSVGMILAAQGEADIVFDRCPLDFIAYLEVLGEKEGIDWTPSGKLLGGIEKALATLDLIAFLPLSAPDEIATTIEYPRLRRAVDLRLKAIIREDALGLLADGLAVLEIRGSRADRVALLDRAISGHQGALGADGEFQ
ncbi:MAG: AAA family ATPase [Devosia nanyangense]|jgi:GTPase SAR1 family protein|nr:AAA family ATPase [Devosia nanyangense]